MTKRIVVMAGGTGGHVFPALAVAQALAEKGWEVSWLGTKKGIESRVIPENDIAIDWLSVAGVRGKGLSGKITAVFMLVKACLQAVKILRNRKPDVVLGMGGFVAGPGGLMAKMLGIPLVIHEQNRVPGTTNRLLARIANRVLQAFPGSFNEKVNATCTGNPLRKAFLNQPEKMAVKTNESVRLLIVGGSQGAQALNENVPDALAEIKDIQVRHQSGYAMRDQIEARYKELGINAQVSAFITDIVAAYQWADLVICRAGAMTVSEVSAVGIPAIFVPLPGAIDDHQTANAKYLTDAGAAIIVLQKDLNKTTLVKAINRVMENMETMSKAAKQSARLDATEAVAGFCIAEAGL